MGLRRKGAWRGSISGVPPCGRLFANAVEVPTAATAGGADGRDGGAEAGALVGAGAPAAAGAFGAGGVRAAGVRAVVAARAGASFTRVNRVAAAALAGVGR